MPAVTPGVPRTSLSIVDLIGNTPLIRLSRFEAGLRSVELWAKAEWKNPGGSVKDRPAARMILDGERAGKLTRDKVILDATSGNTGIAYAMIGAARGYRVRLCVPANVTPERKRILQAYGAEIVFTDPMEGSDGAILRAKAMYAAEPDRYFYPDQYNNPGNWLSHYDTTGPEIIEQTEGRLTHFVAGLGTSGTFVGAGRRLREFNPSIRLISVQPDSPLHGLEGLKHMATAIVPGIYDRALADEDIGVSTEEAFALTRELARSGLFVGISSGANLAGALRVARRVSDALIVVVFCDGGEKYLSERLWDDDDVTEGDRRHRGSDPGDGSTHGAELRHNLESPHHRGLTPLTLQEGIQAAIRQHGVETYPDECCGALIGRGRVVLRAYPLPNTTEEGPRRRFRVRPQDYRDAERFASALGEELLGFYHSHPDHPAQPSQYDLDHAWPVFSYVIVSVRSGVAEEMTSWCLRDDRSAFDQEDLTYAQHDSHTNAAAPLHRQK